MIFKNTVWQVKPVKTNKKYSGRIFRVIEWTDMASDSPFVSLAGFYIVKFLDTGEEMLIEGMDMRKNAEQKRMK